MEKIVIVLVLISLDFIVGGNEDHGIYFNLAEDVPCGNSEANQIIRSSRIIGGEPAKIGEFPFLASIQKEQEHFCTAFIVSKNVMISAAHCFIESMHGSDSYKNYQILVGSNNWTATENVTTFRITNVVIHPQYSYLKPNVENDIAVLKLDRAMEWSQRIQPICLATSKLEPQELGLVAGWGVRAERQTCNGFCLLNEWMQDTALHKVQLPIWTNQACQNEYRKHRVNWNTKSTHICAGFQEMERDTCHGDSGSPLILHGKDGRKIAYGIVSVGEGCATKLPGIYTRVASFLSWLKLNS